MSYESRHDRSFCDSRHVTCNRHKSGASYDCARGCQDTRHAAKPDGHREWICNLSCLVDIQHCSKDANSRSEDVPAVC